MLTITTTLLLLIVFSAPTCRCRKLWGRLEDLKFDSKGQDTFVVVPDDASADDPSSCEGSSLTSVLSRDRGPVFLSNVTVLPMCGEGIIAVVDGRDGCNVFLVDSHVHVEGFEFRCEGYSGERGDLSSFVRVTGVGRAFNVTLKRLSSNNGSNEVRFETPPPVVVRASPLLPEGTLRLNRVTVEQVVGGSVVLERTSGSIAVYDSTLLETIGSERTKIHRKFTPMLDWDLWGAATGAKRKDEEKRSCALEMIGCSLAIVAAVVLFAAVCAAARMHSANRRAAEDAFIGKTDESMSAAFDWDDDFEETSFSQRERSALISSSTGRA